MQSNISGNKNDPRQILAEDQARRGAKDGCGRAGNIDLPMGKQRDRAFVVRIGSIGMNQGVQGRKNRHGLQRQKETEQQRGSASPFLS
jgi:hypothetical protein